MTVSFELATPYRTAEVLSMMAEFNAIDNYPFDPEEWRQNLEAFTSNPELGRLWVILLEEAVIGYLVLSFGFSFEYRGRDGLIDEFYIREDFRGQGIGRQAMEFVETQARALGIQALHLEVERHNERGNRLYRQRGYKGKDRDYLTKWL